MNKCICIECENQCYEYENSITSDKAYYEWSKKEEKCLCEQLVELEVENV